MGFSQALSGLAASATNLEVIGNNIANSQTVGYKGSRAQFADVFAGADVGLGTRISKIMQDFSSGTLESTGRDLDLAIDGGGFFRLMQADQVVYSRNGQFSVDAEGYVINGQNARLTGYPAGGGGGGNPIEMQVPSGALQAQASTDIAATLNLDGAVPEIDTAAVGYNFDPNDAATYSYANNVTLFDSQGNALNTTMYFTKSAPNTWEVRLAQDGQIAKTAPGSTIDQVTTVTFDENGVLQSTESLGAAAGDPDIIGTTGVGPFVFGEPNPGVADMTVEMDLAGTTQFGDEFDMKNIDQDGYASGSLVGVEIDKAGNIIGNYSNEEARQLGTIAMANFSNPEGLRSVGDNAWAESSESGQPLLGYAGIGQFGRIESGVVENSNVDLTRQLVDLIIAQRNYQANSQTIKVQDEVLQSAVNLR